MKRWLSRSLTVLVPAVILLLTVGASRASADSITYYLTTSNTAGYTGDYVRVNVTQSGNTATLTYNALTNGGYTYLMGDGGSADANINGAFSIVGGNAGITGANTFAGFTPGGFTQDVAGTADGFGNFNLKIKDFDGFNNSATQISFSLLKASGTWSSAADVFFGNGVNTGPYGTGEILAAHVFPCATPCTTSQSPPQTMFVSGASTTPTTVPEPVTLTLFGTGLAFIGRAYRRRRAQ